MCCITNTIQILNPTLLNLLWILSDHATSQGTRMTITILEGLKGLLGTRLISPLRKWKLNRNFLRLILKFYYISRSLKWLSNCSIQSQVLMILAAIQQTLPRSVSSLRSPSFKMSYSNLLNRNLQNTALDTFSYKKVKVITWRPRKGTTLKDRASLSFL